LWTVCDAIYFHNIHRGVMRFGLWRYRWERWAPRPYYHYYAALCRAFRPGMKLLKTSGADDRVNLLAAEEDGRLVVAVLNKSARELSVTLSLPATAGGSMERVGPRTTCLWFTARR